MALNKKQKIAIGIVSGIALIGFGILAWKKGWIFKKDSITWSFKDNVYTETSDKSNRIGFIGSTKPPFKVGDTINIIQDEGAVHSDYDGETSILSIYQKGSDWIVQTNKQWLGNTAENGGVIELVD